MEGSISHERLSVPTFDTVSLVDDASYLLQDATKGFVIFVVGDNEHWGIYTMSTAGVVGEVVKSSATVEDTDTDAKFCIYDTGTQVALKNRLGSTKDVLVMYFAMP